MIYDCLDCRKVDLIPEKQMASGNVKTFFCIQRGEVRVTTRSINNSNLYTCHEFRFGFVMYIAWIEVLTVVKIRLV